MDNTWYDGQSQGVSYTPCIDLSGCENSAGEQMLHPTEQDEVQEVREVAPAVGLPPSSHGKDKGVAKRCGNYSGTEDELLCSAYLNVSKDPIVGANQATKSYWARVYQYFNEYRKTPIQRSRSSLQHRWGEINRDTAQFASFYGEIDRKNQSGKCEDDKIKDALQLYEGLDKGPFKFLHCWFILRREQKWIEDQAPKPKKTKSTSSPTEPSQDGQTETVQEETEGFVRPMGRDRAKKQRSNSSVNSQSMACLEVLQNIQSDRARFEAEMQAAAKDESKEVSDRYEAKLAIQREQVAIQKKQMALQEEQMALSKEQMNIQKKTLELQEKDRIDRVMNLDIDKKAPWIRDYYITEQKEIWAKKTQGQSSGQTME